MLYRQYFTSMAGMAMLLLGLAWGTRCPAQIAPKGYFHLGTGSESGQLFSPTGQPFVIRAVAGLRIESPASPDANLSPAAVDRRSAAILARLRGLGFNTIGGESDADLWGRGMPYIESLDLAAHLANQQQEPMVNVFDPHFSSEVNRWVAMACAPRAGDASLIGYLSDAGLGWDPATHATAVLAFYLRLPPGTTGRDHAENYLRDRYGSSIQPLDRAWGVKAEDFIDLPIPKAGNLAFARDAAPFAALVLARYLQTVANAIHAADPNHLFLGAGLEPPRSLPQPGGPAPDTSATLLWRIPDVISVRLPASANPPAVLRRLLSLSRRPVLVHLSGCAPVAASTRAALANPRVIGYVWSPGTDWTSGKCAAQAKSFWSAMNGR